MSDQARVFDSSLADCGACELKERCAKGRTVVAKPAPEKFNGIMLLGEAPSGIEVTRAAPMSGPAGQLLDSLLEAAGIDRNECYATNAVLCQPGPGGKGDAKKTLHGRYPNAIYSCLPRLEEELAVVRPKVVVAFGEAALVAATGGTKKKAMQVDVDCQRCVNTRKVGPALACANAKAGCDWHHIFVGKTDAEANEERPAFVDMLGGACPKCGANLKRLRIRAIKCPGCGGRKKKIVEKEIFTATYTKIGEVAGALFRASTLPSRWDEFGVDWVIATFHPSFLLHGLKVKEEGDRKKKLGGQFAARAVVDHLEKALRLTKRPQNFRFSTTITDRAEDVRAFLEPGAYSIDIETNAKSEWDVSDLRCVGIGRVDREETLVVDTTGMLDIQVIEPEEEGEPLRYNTKVKDRELFDALKEFFTWPAYKKILQGGDYDALVIWRLMGLVIEPIVIDTKLAHHALYPDEPHNLGHIASEMTDAEYWKPPKEIKGAQAWRDFEELAVYNSKDLRTTDLSAEKMCGRVLDEPEVWEAPTGVPIRRWSKGGLLDHVDHQTRRGFDVAMEILPIAIEMEHKGIPINLDRMREVEAEIVPKIDALADWMREYVSRDDFNPRSNDQLTWALYDPAGPCKLTAPGQTKTGGLSTSKDALAKIAHHEFVQQLLAFRDLDATRKVIHGKGLIIREDGRIHPSWNTAGTVSWRWTSSPNFQNLDLEFRRMIEAPDGWMIVGADESQLEMRILAGLSGDRELIRRCIESDETDKLNPECDPHSYVGSEFFGPAYNELVPHRRDPEMKRKLDALRTITKTVFYALGYGSGPSTILEGIYKKGYSGSVPLTLQIVKGAMAKIFELFPGIKRWTDGAVRSAEKEWAAYSALLRRRRTFPLGIVESTVARNFPIQASAADVVDLRTLAYRRALHKVAPTAHPFAQVHDALYTLCREEDAEAVARCKEEQLSCEVRLTPDGPMMPFIASAKIGKTMYEVS